MKAPDFVPFNASAAALSGTDVLWDPPYDLHGSGYTVGIWDSGAIYPHVEFGDRLTLMDWGDPVEVSEGEVPVYWACGVTPQNVLREARVPFCITHAPGHMLVADVAEDADIPVFHQEVQ